MNNISFLHTVLSHSEESEPFFCSPFPSPHGKQAGAGGALPKDYMKPPPGFALHKVQVAKTHPAFELKAFFLKENTSFQEHLDLQTKQYHVYCPVLLQLLHQGVDLGSTTKSRILAAAWARRDYALAKHCLYLKGDVFGLPEVLKAVRILDAPRRMRALEKKLQRLQAQGTAKAKTLGAIRSKLNDLRRDTPEGQATSVTGALRCTFITVCDRLV